MGAKIMTQENWKEVTHKNYEGIHIQTEKCWQSDKDGRLLSIEKGVAHGKRFTVNIINSPFWEDPFILDTVSHADNINEAESIAENYMQNNE